MEGMFVLRLPWGAVSRGNCPAPGEKGGIS